MTTKVIWGAIAVFLGSWVIGNVLKIAEGTIHWLLLPVVVLGVINVRRGSSGPATE